MLIKLTKKQEEQIPNYIDKWIKMASGKTDLVESQKYVNKIYASMGKKEPIFFCLDSPLSACLAVAIVRQLHSQLGRQLFSPLFSQLDRQLFGQLFKQLGNQLFIRLFKQLSSQLDSQLRSQLFSPLDSQFRNQLLRQLLRQLHNQLSSQLGSQLGSKLLRQLSSQLHSQLNSQLFSPLGSQLFRQFGSKLFSPLGSKLFKQLGSRFFRQLHSQLFSQLGNKLDSQLFSQLDNQLGNKLDSQLFRQLFSQLHNQPLRQLNKINNDWYLSLWWLSWCGYYDFAKMIGVDFDIDKFDLLIGFLKNIIFCVPYDGIFFMSKKPINVSWKNKLLHCENGPAIEFEDGYGLWALNGVTVTKEVVETPKELLKTT